LHIEYEKFKRGLCDEFLFGIVKDEEKDNSCAYEKSKMAYYGYNNRCGITNYIKGPSM